MSSTFRGPDHFEPGTTNPAASWAEYKAIFQIYAAAVKLQNEELPTQVASFLYTIGPVGRKVYDSLTLPLTADQPSPTLEQIYAAFDSYYAPYNNPDSSRYKFFHTRQKQSQPFDDFFTDLRAQARNCEFDTLTDSLLRYQILAGVYNSELRKKLFSHRRLTLDQAITICQADETSTTYSESIRTSPPRHPTAGVDALQRHGRRQQGLRPSRHTSIPSSHMPLISSRPTWHPQAAQSIQRRTQPSTQLSGAYRPRPTMSTQQSCSNCGLQHHRQAKCPATGSTCHNCRRKGHWASLCRSRFSSQSLANINSGEYFLDHSEFPQEDAPSLPFELHPDAYEAPTYQDSLPTHRRYVESLEFDSDDSTAFTLYTLTASCDAATDPRSLHADDEWYDSIYIHNMPNLFKLDSGSQVNILPYDIYEALPVKPPLQPPIRRILAYTGHTVPVLGVVTLPCASFLATQQLEFYIALNNTTPILGAKALESLALVQRIRHPQRTAPSLSAAVLQTSCTDEDPINIVKQYPDVFDRIGKLPIKYDIELKPNALPFISVAHKLPHALRKPVYDELQAMLKQGIITPVQGPTEWVHPMVVQRKPDGGIRICLDPRKLNPAIRRPYFPMMTAQEIFSQVHGSTIFSVLDAKNAFWQVELTERSSYLCTFATPFGTFRFLRLPYGISTASEVFQQVMTKLFPPNEFPNTFISTDDFLLAAADASSHNQLLRKILETARQAGLTFSSRKLQLAVPKIKYLGHIISPGSIEVDPERIRAIVDLPPPDDKRALQRFLGMVNYVTRFLPAYSEQAAPLRALLKKDSVFQWDQNKQVVYDQLKTLISRAPILAAFDPIRPCKITVDASSNGIGAALLQENRPVEYASTTLNATQKRYSQIEKEFLGIVFACEKFHYYIVGKNVHIETDHKPLLAIIHKPMHLLSPRLQRMVLRLLRYNFTLTYVPGTKLQIADTLSRSALSQTAIDTSDMEGSHAALHSLTVLSESKRAALIKAIQQDPTYQTLLTYIYQGWPHSLKKLPPDLVPYWAFQEELHEDEGIIYRGNRLVIPSVMRTEVMQQLHSIHQGVTACLAKARLHVFWPQITADITAYIKNCQVCRARDLSNPPIRLHPHQIPSLPWETVATDIFQVQNSKLIVLVDYFSKFIEAQELRTTTADSVITFLKPHFARYGAPQRILSDNGPPFSSFRFNEFLREWGVQHITSSPYYPSSNGMAERSVQTIKNLLEKAKKAGKDLQYVLLEYRSTPTGNLPTPAEMLMGRQLRNPMTTTTASLLPKYPIEQIQKTLYERQQRMVRNQKSHRYPLPTLFYTGDLVYYQKGIREWLPAMIVEPAMEPHSYILVDPHGKTFRRTRSHLRPRDTESSQGNSNTRIYSSLTNSSNSGSVEAEGVVTGNFSGSRVQLQNIEAPMQPTRSSLVQSPPNRNGAINKPQQLPNTSNTVCHGAINKPQQLPNTSNTVRLPGCNNGKTISPSPFPTTCPPFGKMLKTATTTRSGRVIKKPTKLTFFF